MLADLETRGYNVILLQQNSSKMLNFIKDTLKKTYDVDQTSILQVGTKGELKRIKEIQGISPPFSEYWFVEVALDSVPIKELMPVIVQSNTCVFFVTTNKYKNYKYFKEELNKRNTIRYKDYYLSYLKRRDISYLYYNLVPEDKRLTSALFNQVVASYSGDIDALFTLFEYLSKGTEIKSMREITSLIGMGGLTIESYIFMLLKEKPPTDRGKKRYRKDRLQASRELGVAYDWNTFYNYVRKAVVNIVEIKMLIISGVIYKEIKDIPDCYDIAALSRYRRYLWTIKEIPMSRLLQLFQNLSIRRWNNEVDCVSFLYNFYS